MFKKPSNLILLLFLICILLIPHINTLKLSFPSHRTQLPSFETTSHFLTTQQNTTMRIDYNKIILSLNKDKFLKSADINTKLIQIQQQNLNQQQQIKLLSQIRLNQSTQFISNRLNCANIKDNQISSLLSRTAQMRIFLQNTMDNINFISDEKDKIISKNNIRNQIIYLKSIEKFFSSKCKDTNIKVTNTQFISNPNSNNWILGQWTYHEFVQSYIEKMNLNPSTNKCPLDKPFFNGYQCINCVYPNNIWQMKSQKCSSCPYPLIVNQKTRKCVSEIHYVSNIVDTPQAWITRNINIDTAINNFNKQKMQSNAIVCPYATPFILNEKCSTCPENNVYVLDQRRCNPIPYNMYYDKNLHKVVQRLQKYQTNKDFSNLIQDNLTECPSQFPYFDTLTCINCVFPQFYNQRTKSCELCVNLEACGIKKNKYATNNEAINLTGKNTEDVKKYITNQQALMDDIDTLECPISQPFFNPQQRKCIACPTDKSIYNISISKCVSCPSRSQFNSQTFLCKQLKPIIPPKPIQPVTPITPVVPIVPVSPVIPKTNSKAPNLLIENLTSYQSQQQKINGTQCSLTTPYSTGKQCITCSSRQLFNTTSKTCTNCPNNYIYNKDKYQCIKNQTIPITTPNMKYKNWVNAQRLWIQNMTQYNKRYSQSKDQQCPSSTPYSQGDKCINCQQTEIFNTSSLKCTQCPLNTQYNSTLFRCIQILKPIVPPPVKQTYISNLKYGVPPYYSVNKTDIYNKYQQGLKNGSKICPFETPFSTGIQCIKCDNTTDFFNLDTLKCQKCQTGYKFNFMISQCQQDPTAYYTNLNSKNLIYDGQPYAYYKYKQDQAIKSGAKPCDLSTPYYNLNNNCEICPQQSPYFDLLRRKCINCPLESTYTQLEHQCLTPIGDYVGPETTLEKSLANLFV